MEVLAIDFCQSIKCLKNRLIIRYSSTGELSRDLISLGSCKLQDPENIFCENNEFYNRSYKIVEFQKY
jgi:hypothetical protein